MNTINITSSSFLPPNNLEWNKLNKTIFSDFGDWYNFLIKCSKKESLAFVFFIEDFIELDKLNYNQDSFKLDNIIKSLESRIRSAKKPTIFISSFWIKENICRTIKQETYIDKLKIKFQKKIKDLSLKYSLFFNIDIDKEFSYWGYSNVFEKRNWYFARCRLSSLGIKIISDTIKKILDRYLNPTKKVLVLDCDNTLWGGVIGEDEKHGIKLGEDGMGTAFQDFQRAAKFLQKNGTILTLSSKNNAEDVWDVFKNHSGMILKKKDIVSSRINWKEKYLNLISMSEELDLNLDSFVFWDDNPMERAKIKKNLPEVEVIDVPKDISNWSELLYTSDFFTKFVFTIEDSKKTQQYRSRAKFRKKLNNVNNEIEYLKSINLSPKLIKIDNYNISRAEQLCEKTNQFNLRCIRHKEKSINNLTKNKNNIIFLVSLKDIYGDHGIIGFVLIKKLDNKVVFLDSFIMSCRILGRHLESWMLNQSINLCKKKGFKKLISEYVPSKKNQMVKDFFINNDFKHLSKDDKKYLDNFKKNSKNLFFADINKIDIPYLDAYK